MWVFKVENSDMGAEPTRARNPVTILRPPGFPSNINHALLP